MKNNLIIILVAAFMTVSCNTSSNKNAKEKVVAELNKVEKLAKKSQETLDIANAYMAAMGKGDIAAMNNLMHEDMVWQNAGDSEIPWMGPWNGKKAILEKFFPAFGKGFITKKWEPTDSFASGDTAAYFGQMIGLLTGSNKETNEFTYALRVKVKDGKIILWNWFEDSYEVSKTYQNK